METDDEFTARVLALNADLAAQVCMGQPPLLFVAVGVAPSVLLLSMPAMRTPLAPTHTSPYPTHTHHN